MIAHPNWHFEPTPVDELRSGAHLRLSQKMGDFPSSVNPSLTNRSGIPWYVVRRQAGNIYGDKSSVYSRHEIISVLLTLF